MTNVSVTGVRSEWSNVEARATPPPSADVDAAREALVAYAFEPFPGSYGLQLLTAFEAAIRAAALDEARAAVKRAIRGRLPEEGADAEDVEAWGYTNLALAAIDALRDGAE